MTAHLASHVAQVTYTVAAVCPKAPPGMQAYQDQVTGWLKWMVIGLMGLGVLASLAAIPVGRIMHIPRVSQAGTIGLAVLVVVAIAYKVFPGILSGIIGTGC